MNLQNLTLISLKQSYPEITLREVSSLTGLDQTRVHRIFKGHEMKLTEYQIFNNLIEKKSSNKSTTRLHALIDEALECLDEQILNNFFMTIERKILSTKIKNNTKEESLCLMA